MMNGCRRSGRIAVAWAAGVCAGLAFAGPATGQREQAVASERAWQTLLLDADRAGDRVVAVGSHGHVVLSDDAGVSWRQAESVPTRTTLTDVHFSDEQNGWAVGHDAIVIHTRDGGETWSLQHRDPEANSPLFAIWLDKSGRGFAAGAYGLALETDDGGAHWQTVQVGAPGEDLHLNAVFRAEDGALFIAAEGGVVYRSRDAGRSWTRAASGYEGSFWGGLALEDGRLLVFGMRGSLFVSEDGGEQWRALPRVTRHSLGGAAQLAMGEVVIAGLGGAVLISPDGGRSFTARTRPGREGANAVLALPRGGALLLGEGGAQRFNLDDWASME